MAGDSSRAEIVPPQTPQRPQRPQRPHLPHTISASALTRGVVDGSTEALHRSIHVVEHSAETATHLIKTGADTAKHALSAAERRRRRRVIRLKIWWLVNDPFSSPEAKLYHVCVATMVCVAIGCTLVFSVPNTDDGVTDTDIPTMLSEVSFEAIQAGVGVFVVCELFVRWLVSEAYFFHADERDRLHLFRKNGLGRPHYTAYLEKPFWENTWNYLDMVASVPAVLQILLPDTNITEYRFLYMWRLMIVTRVARMTPFSHSAKTLLYTISATWSTLVIPITFFGLFALFMGTAVWYSEPCYTHDECEFPNVFSAAYFTVVTMTTTGYGDAVPTRTVSRMITVFMCICGSLCLAMPLAIIDVFFNSKWHQKIVAHGNRNRATEQIQAFISFRHQTRSMAKRIDRRDQKANHDSREEHKNEVNEQMRKAGQSRSAVTCASPDADVEERLMAQYAAPKRRRSSLLIDNISPEDEENHSQPNMYEKNVGRVLSVMHGFETTAKLDTYGTIQRFIRMGRIRVHAFSRKQVLLMEDYIDVMALLVSAPDLDLNEQSSVSEIANIERKCWLLENRLYRFAWRLVDVTTRIRIPELRMSTDHITNQPKHVQMAILRKMSEHELRVQLTHHHKHHDEPSSPPSIQLKHSPSTRPQPQQRADWRHWLVWSRTSIAEDTVYQSGDFEGMQSGDSAASSRAIRPVMRKRPSLILNDSESDSESDSGEASDQPKILGTGDHLGLWDKAKRCWAAVDRHLDQHVRFNQPLELCLAQSSDKLADKVWLLLEYPFASKLGDRLWQLVAFMSVLSTVLFIATTEPSLNTVGESSLQCETIVWQFCAHHESAAVNPGCFQHNSTTKRLKFFCSEDGCYGQGNNFGGPGNHALSCADNTAPFRASGFSSNYYYTGWLRNPNALYNVCERPNCIEHDHALQLNNLFVLADAVTNAFWTVEFWLKVYSSRKRWAWLSDVYTLTDGLALLGYYSNLIRMLVTGQPTLDPMVTAHLPTWLLLLSTVRVLRILKVTKQLLGWAVIMETLESCSSEILPFAALMVLFALISGAAIFVVENDLKCESGSGCAGDNIPDLLSGVWLSYVTITSVGYGRLYPTTFFGQVCALFAMLAGAFYISMPLTVVVNSFKITADKYRTANEEIKRLIDHQKGAGYFGNTSDKASFRPFSHVELSDDDAARVRAYRAHLDAYCGLLHTIHPLLKKLQHSRDARMKLAANMRALHDAVFPEGSEDGATAPEGTAQPVSSLSPAEAGRLSNLSAEHMPAQPATPPPAPAAEPPPDGPATPPVPTRPKLSSRRLRPRSRPAARLKSSASSRMLEEVVVEAVVEMVERGDLEEKVVNVGDVRTELQPGGGSGGADAEVEVQAEVQAEAAAAEEEPPSPGLKLFQTLRESGVWVKSSNEDAATQLERYFDDYSRCKLKEVLPLLAALKRMSRDVQRLHVELSGTVNHVVRQLARCTTAQQSGKQEPSIYMSYE